MTFRGGVSLVSPSVAGFGSPRRVPPEWGKLLLRGLTSGIKGDARPLRGRGTTDARCRERPHHPARRCNGPAAVLRPLCEP